MSQPSILGLWYATPISMREAEQLVIEADQRLIQRLRHGGGTLCCRLLLMHAKFRQGLEISGDYHNLQRLAARSAHGRALLELIYGQLLLSRQLNGALEHLEQGFNLARNLFTADDYFTVLKRHHQLRQLPLAKQPSSPSSLEQLLVTAQVIERMEQPEKQRGEYQFDNHDTYG